jgi:hypothetical protein
LNYTIFGSKIICHSEYGKLWETKKGYFDIRNFFTTIPASNCPPENWEMPDVDLENIFNPIEEDSALPPMS